MEWLTENIMAPLLATLTAWFWYDKRLRDTRLDELEKRIQAAEKQKTETLIKALEARAMIQESERMVQTQKIVTLGRSLTAHLENAATQLDRIETILETCKNECSGGTLEDKNG